MSSRPRRPRSTSTSIGVASFALAVLAMAIDHLVGTENGGDDEVLVDPLTFTVSVAVSGAAALVLFGWLIPRATVRGSERAATTGLVCSVSSVIPGVGLLWLGLPFVTAGAGVALGLEGRRGVRRRQAVAAIVVGSTVLCLGTALYVYALAAS
jgi:hypothetical protein